MKDIAVPQEYTIFRQDLSSDYLNVEKMGVLNTFNEARGMCKVFNEVDKDVVNGKANYFLACTKIVGE